RRVVLPTRRKTRLHPPGQADRELFYRVLQWETPRRVSERERISVARARSSDPAQLAGGLQSHPSARIARPSDPERVRPQRSENRPRGTASPVLSCSKIGPSSLAA